MKKSEASRKNKNLETYKLISNQILTKGEGSYVKGKVVCLDEKVEFGIDDFPENKEDVAFHLAIALDDEENLAWYQKLARERRRDLLRNCLKITLKAFLEQTIKKTKAAYFAGVVKQKTFQQERLNEYKKKHQKHTTYYDYNHSVPPKVHLSYPSEKNTDIDIDEISKEIDRLDIVNSSNSSQVSRTISQMNSDEQLETLRSVFGQEVDWVEETARGGL